MSVVILDLKNSKCCADCKFSAMHYEKDIIGYTAWTVSPIYGSDNLKGVYCNRAISGSKDIVTGEDVAPGQPVSADLIRTDGTLCGIDGRWFEPLDNENTIA